ncbi:MAG: hypothetical protein AAGC88_15145 [Bacteroidota bacterium]
MEKVIRAFHYLSFIKYPILLIGLYFYSKPFFSDGDDMLSNMNTGLIFVGIGISLDSLKDYGKLNWLDKTVLYRPALAKYYFILLGVAILSLIFVGIKGYLSTNENNLKELSIGFIVFGVGMIGFLKSGIEATKKYIDEQK